MANPKHLAKLKEGVNAWNKFQVERAEEYRKTMAVCYRGVRDQDWMIRAAGADLRSQNLRGAYLVHVDLSGANLDGADISQAKLQIANLSGV